MRIGKQFGCAALAAAMCLCSLQLPADADAMGLDTYSIGAYYVVNHNGVISCFNKYYVAGIDDEWIDYDHFPDEYGYTFNEGDVVYAMVGYTTPSGKAQGITWGSCSNQQDTQNGWQWYGWIDMAYLTPYDEYIAPEPEPEPEPEPVITEPPTEPPTEAPTTVVATAATTVVTTILTTLAPTEAETTLLTTAATTTTEQTDTVLSIVDDQNDDHKNDFFSNNFALLLLGGVVVLLAGSGALAIGLLQHNKKKQTFLPNQNAQNGQGTVAVQLCPHCGTQNSNTASFCRNCGKSMKS